MPAPDPCSEQMADLFLKAVPLIDNLARLYVAKRCVAPAAAGGAAPRTTASASASAAAALAT